MICTALTSVGKDRVGKTPQYRYRQVELPFLARSIGTDGWRTDRLDLIQVLPQWGQKVGAKTLNKPLSKSVWPVIVETAAVRKPVWFGKTSISSTFGL